jgi:regulatory protein
MDRRSKSSGTVAQTWRMARRTSPPPPLDAATLERLALRYVERFATTRGKLGDYLRRKLRERGWAGEGEPPVAALVERVAAAGYVDDGAWAAAKAAAMTRRGLGAGRVRQALSIAGVEADDSARVEPTLDDRRIESAVAFARRRRLGPYAPAPHTDRAAIERDVGRMVRAGHAPDLARRIMRFRSDRDAELTHAGAFDDELIRSLS